MAMEISVEAIRQCVMAGMGLALLPAIVVARGMRQHQIRALRWSGPSLDIATHLIWQKDERVFPAMAAFQELIQQKLDDSEVAGAGLVLAGSLAD